MKNLFVTFLTCLILIGVVSPLFAQDETGEKSKSYARNAFESGLLIDNQTVVIPTKGTLEWDIQHRFGTIENGIGDLFGMYAPSNIRMGFTYSALDRLNVGFGFTKFNKYLDFNAKYLLVKQTKDNRVPVSLAYYGNVGLDARPFSNFEKEIHRYSYFHELMIARRFNTKLSAQVSSSFSHFNAVDSLVSHDMIGIGVSGRYKVGGSSSVIVDYNLPLTQHQGVVEVKPNISFGIEMATSGHAFQFFVGNYQNLVPQRNLTFNENKFSTSGLLIGFNITRMWNL